MRMEKWRVTWLLAAILLLAGRSVQADSWLVAVLSGNARADAWLVPLSGKDEPQALLHEQADIKTDAEFLGYTGNIAFDHFRVADHFAGQLTDKLLAKLLPQLERLKDKGLLGESPEFSFLYAIAGLDAVDGHIYGYSSSEGRQALSIYEGIVDEQFRSHGLTLGAMAAAHDGALLLEAVKGQEDSAHVVIYDDTYGEGYLVRDGEVIKQKAAFTDTTPAGGYYQLGREGEELLNSDNEGAGRLSLLVREFWKKQNIDYTTEELLDRYSKTNRNELGGVMSRLIQDKESFLRPEFTQTVDGLVDLSKQLTCPYAKKVPVKIIGFYGETLKADEQILQGRFANLTEGRLIPELVTGEQLNNALASAAVRVYRQVMKARYGFE
ncbi:hypothetical protein M3P05_18775 [Sansalvadorimonas sp. 2012CJ34-2]|uniref:Uncharacterized protein n=1 Tax=Parendozoicomonas callyspongiae TaxID=2942213 RepID=A0ABT0PKS3_9GAMM|nr:hypothetical protein [Sansalvadorimonas sp. 2012CJ34-2]MCL6271968.1 hypothetical protein [Sansalvadorimonas sp. 2012CJ34-2]